MNPELLLITLGGALSSTVLGTIITVLWNRSKTGQELLRADLAAERARTDRLAKKLDSYFSYMMDLRSHVLIMHEGTGILSNQILAVGEEPLWRPPAVPPIPD